MFLNTDRKSPRPPLDLSSVNIFKDGFESKVTGLAEDHELMQKTFDALYITLKPMNSFDAWVVQEMSMITMKIDRCARIDRRLRDRSSLRAQAFWDDDRRTAAILLGSKLASDPERIADQLRKTPHGCEWMIKQWSALAYLGETQPSLTPEQKSMAFDLLGTPKIFRVGEPGAEIDSDGRLTVLDLTFSSMARRQISGLRARRDEVAPADSLDRAMAAADVRDPDDTEFRQLRRYSSALHHRFRWFKALLPKWPPNCHNYTNLHFDYLQDPKPAQAPEAAKTEEIAEVAVEVAAEIEVEADVEVEQAEVPRPAGDRAGSRLDKADRRREAKLRKLERRRA